jgi:hypothetical protein
MADSASAARATLAERGRRYIFVVMRSLFFRLALAPLAVALGACSSDAAEPRSDAPTSDGSLLTTFDRLTIGVGDRATFRAFLVSETARLGSSGLVFASGAPSVARVTAVGGRAQVQGVTAGRTWVVVRNAVAADSVEVVVQ